MHFSKNKSSNRLKYSDTLKYQIQIYIFRYAVVGCVVDGLVDGVVDEAYKTFHNFKVPHWIQIKGPKVCINQHLVGKDNSQLLKLWAFDCLSYLLTNFQQPC